MHIESVKLLVDELARLILPLGTTAIVADPHEIANVLGSDGVHWLLDACDHLQLDVYFMAPSCVPASPFESPRRPLTPGDLEALMRRNRVLGLAEMMNFPGVVAGLPSELGKLALEGAQHVDGHAPGLLGRGLQAYAASGIRSDHECLTAEEGRERLRAGMWLLIREASMARNLEALLPLALEYGPNRIAFCTDDRDPDDVADNGHINGMVREAVRMGATPEDALVMASFNPALWHGLRHLGAVAPGYQADLLLLPDLVGFMPDVVLKRGRPIEDVPSVAVPEWVRQTVRIKPVTAADFAIPSDGSPIRAIGLIEDQVVTESVEREPVVVGRERRRGRRRRAREDRGRRAPPCNGAGRARVRLRLGPDERRARLDRRTRRPQPRRPRHDRRGHGLRRPAPGRDRRRHRGRRRRPGRGRVPASRRRPPLRRAARGGDRAERRHERRRARPRLDGRDAVPDDRVPRALGDPVAEDHRSRARRRRPVRARSAEVGA